MEVVSFPKRMCRSSKTLAVMDESSMKVISAPTGMPHSPNLKGSRRAVSFISLAVFSFSYSFRNE